MNYRIKTRKEFIKKYGHDWQSIVTYSWNQDMDYLMGHYLSKEENVKLLQSTIDKPLRIENYSISMDMVESVPFIDIASYSRLHHLTKLL